MQQLLSVKIEKADPVLVRELDRELGDLDSVLIMLPSAVSSILCTRMSHNSRYFYGFLDNLQEVLEGEDGKNLKLEGIKRVVDKILAIN